VGLSKSAHSETVDLLPDGFIVFDGYLTAAPLCFFDRRKELKQLLISV
jgi:hypothetical protein